MSDYEVNFKLLNDKINASIQQRIKEPIVFASIMKPFDPKVIELVVLDTSLSVDKRVDAIKQYLNTYFATTSEGQYVEWRGNNDVRFLSQNELNGRIPSIIVNNIVNGRLIRLFETRDYVKNHLMQQVKIEFDVSSPIVRRDEDGNILLNIFEGFLHTEKKKFDDYDKEVKDGVKFIWKHIKEIWCSNKKDQFAYAKKWICHTVNGEKMQTALILKSVQGTGKSSISEFLMEHVIGQKASSQINNSKSFTSHFNKELHGKTFVVLEEPAQSESDWNNLGNSLKNPITGKVLQIEGKGENPIKVKNIMSIIIFANHDPFKIESSDRRFIYLDVSSKYQFNKEWNEKLALICKRRDIGEAFYWYCKEYCETDKEWFSGDKSTMPESTAKMTLLVDNLHSFYKYLKIKYVLKNEGFNIPLIKLKENYINELKIDKGRDVHRYNNSIKLEKVTSNKIHELLKDISIYLVKGSHNVNYVKISADELREKYKIRNWIGEFDLEDAEYNDKKETEDQELADDIENTPISNFIKKAEKLKPIHEIPIEKYIEWHNMYKKKDGWMEEALLRVKRIMNKKTHYKPTYNIDEVVDALK